MEGTKDDEYLKKFEELVVRLEKASQAGAASVAQVTPVVSQAPVTAPTGGSSSAFLQKYKDTCFKNVPALLAATKEHGNEQLAAGVQLYMDMLNSQEAVLSTMAACSKPASAQFMVTIVQDKKKALFALGKPGRAVGTHLRCLEDSVNLYVWFTCSEKADEFKDTLADFFGNIDIQGQKLCDMTPIDKKWYQAFRLVHKDFFEFVKAGFPTIMRWSGSDVKAEAIYKGHLAGAGAPTSAPVSQPNPEEVKQAAAPAKSAPAKASIVPKNPVKVLRFKTWEVSNYVNETITFSGDEVQPGMTFNFFNCEKTKVVI